MSAILYQHRAHMKVRDPDTPRSHPHVEFVRSQSTVFPRFLQGSAPTRHRASPRRHLPNQKLIYEQLPSSSSPFYILSIFISVSSLLTTLTFHQKSQKKLHPIPIQSLKYLASARKKATIGDPELQLRKTQNSVLYR